MNVLITGGTGFIGSRLALRCLGDGHAVRVLGQENRPAESQNRLLIEERGAEVVLGSVADSGVVRRAVEGMNRVFHLAAAQHEMDVPDEHFRNVNVEGTRCVVEACERAGVERLVHGSTIGVYGSPEGPIDEETPCRPDNIYGVTKLEAERVALGLEGRQPAVVIRIPEVYGPGDRRLIKLFQAIEKGAFLMIGKGDNLHHLIYIGDLIDGLLAAATRPEAVGQTILLAGKEAVTTRQMASVIASELGKTLPKWRLPLPPIALVATLVEVTFRPLGIQPPIHRRRLDFFRKSFLLSDARARETLDFRPAVGFREGVRRTAEWYRSEGFLGSNAEAPEAKPASRDREGYEA